MTECPRSSKTPEKLEFLEFDPHTVEISFLILPLGGPLSREMSSRFIFFSLSSSSIQCVGFFLLRLPSPLSALVNLATHLRMIHFSASTPVSYLKLLTLPYNEKRHCFSVHFQTPRTALAQPFYFHEPINLGDFFHLLSLILWPKFQTGLDLLQPALYLYFWRHFHVCPSPHCTRERNRSKSLVICDLRLCLAD